MMRLLVLLLLILLPALAMAQELASTTVTLATGTARGDIVMRVTAPPGTGPLPLVLFSHGNFYSKDDYQPLVAAWAKAGFAVIQPTHLDARVLALPADDPRKPGIWRSRRDDLVYVLDHLDQVTAQAPALRGRVTASRVLVAGHSYGGHTVEMLLGARVRDPETKAWLDLSDARVAGGVLLAPPGPWADLAPNWKPLGVYLDVNWSAMRRPALVVVGELDHGPMSPRDWSWRGRPTARAQWACPTAPTACCCCTMSGISWAASAAPTPRKPAPTRPPSPWWPRPPPTICAPWPPPATPPGRARWHVCATCPWWLGRSAGDYPIVGTAYRRTWGSMLTRVMPSCCAWAINSRSKGS